jgi:hypothetical protein
VVHLKIYTFENGIEKAREWKFEPIDDERYFPMLRDSDSSASGIPRRRPYAKREGRELTLGAGFLLKGDNMRMLERLLLAHKIEWKRKVGKLDQWVEFVLDIDEEVRFEFVESVKALPRITVSLVQKKPLYFTDFENEQRRLQD